MKKTKKKKVYSIYWVWHRNTIVEAKDEEEARNKFDAMKNTDVIKNCYTGSFDIDHIEEEE